MTQAQYIINRKLNIVELANKLGNISEACRNIGVTPASRHDGSDQEILSNRNEVYERAKSKNPNRWSGKTRDWGKIGKVHLNPQRTQDAGEWRSAA